MAPTKEITQLQSELYIAMERIDFLEYLVILERSMVVELLRESDAGKKALQDVEVKIEQMEANVSKREERGLVKATIEIEHLKEALRKAKEKYTLKRAYVVDGAGTRAKRN